MFSLPFLALISSALAGQSIGVMLLKSASQYHFSIPSADGDNVVVGKGRKLELVLNDDSTLVDTVSNKYLFIGQDGYMTLTKTPQKGYAINDLYVTYKGTESFGVINGRIAFDQRHKDFVGTTWRVVKNETIDDVQVLGSSSNSTSPAKPTPIVPPVEGGAASMNFYGAAGILGVAALLI